MKFPWFTKKPEGPAPIVVQRVDGWANYLTGIGTSRDKTTAGSFEPSLRLFDTELLAMYNGSDLASKIVEKPYTEMLRRGYTLSADDVDTDEITDLEKAGAKLRLNELVTSAGVFGGLFGGAILIMGADDGQTPDKPLNEDRIRTFRYLNTLDRRYITVAKHYSDMLAPNFGLPEIYQITNMIGSAMGGSGATTALVHESRVLRFDGARTDALTRQQLAGWTFSTLQRVYDVMRRFDLAFDSVGHLVSDASQAVFKLQGLINMIAAGQGSVVQSRMQMVDMSRSTCRAALIDAETESFERAATSFTGLPEVLDRYMMRLAAAADMPVTELFGRSAAGMNATGEGDTRKWYDLIASRQENELAPKLKRLYGLMAKAADSPITKKDAEFDIQFRPLWSPSDKEQADYQLAVANADNIYLTQGVVTPEQVALGRWGGGKFSSWIDVDANALQKSIDTQKAFDPYAKDPLASKEAVATNVSTAGEQGEQNNGVAKPSAPLDK